MVVVTSVGTSVVGAVSVVVVVVSLESESQMIKMTAVDCAATTPVYAHNCSVGVGPVCDSTRPITFNENNFSMQN